MLQEIIKIKVNKDFIKIIGSMMGITLLAILIFSSIGWIKNLIDAVGIIIIIQIVNVILLTKGWLIDLGEVTWVLLTIIISSTIFLGSKMLVPLVAVTSGSMLHSDNSNWKSWMINHGIPESEISSFPMQNGFARGDMILTITPNGKGTLFQIFPDTKLGDVVIYTRDKLHPGNEPIIHRVVGIVEVKDWKVSNKIGTLDCLKEDDFENTYIQYVRNCAEKTGFCPYPKFPETGNFRFYTTKGDNYMTNKVTDQCGMGGGISLPVTEKQLTARGWIRLPYIGYLKLLLNTIFFGKS